MRSHAVAVAMAIWLGCAGGVFAALLPISGLRTEADWLLARGNAEAQLFVASFDGQAAERQLASFDERRAVLERAHRWRRLQVLLAIAAVISAFGGFALHLLRRMSAEDVPAPLLGFGEDGPPQG